MRKTFGQRIRELRQERDFSLRDFGEKLGTAANPTSPAFLSDLENGRRFPSNDMLARLAQVLGTTEVSAVESKCTTSGRIKVYHPGGQFFSRVEALLARMFGDGRRSRFPAAGCTCSP